MTAIPIPEHFTSRGWEFTLLKRHGKVALFRRYRPDGTCEHWEVVKLYIALERTWPNGRTIPAHEAMPATESWGQRGWTFSPASHDEPYFSAVAKFRELAGRHRA